MWESIFFLRKTSSSRNRRSYLLFANREGPLLYVNPQEIQRHKGLAREVPTNDGHIMSLAELCENEFAELFWGQGRLELGVNRSARERSKREKERASMNKFT